MKNKSQWIYQILSSYYGELGWWPGNPYEIMISAILVQNTSWKNVEKSLENFNNKLTPEYIELVDIDELIEKIKPSGFYINKSKTLKTLTNWYKQYNYSVQKVQQYPLSQLRNELLSLKGIGPESADAILLYSFLFPTFVIDTYTKRFSERFGLSVNLDYQSLQNYYIRAYPNDSYTIGDYHILLLEHGKRHCKKKPNCLNCPFFKDCKYPDKLV